MLGGYELLVCVYPWHLGFGVAGFGIWAFGVGDRLLSFGVWG